MCIVEAFMVGGIDEFRNNPKALIAHIQRRKQSEQNDVLIPRSDGVRAKNDLITLPTGFGNI